MSSTVLILERDKNLGYFSCDNGSSLVATFYGGYAYYEVLDAMLDTFLIEGSVVFGDAPCNKGIVLSTKEEYKTFRKYNDYDIYTELWKWEFAHRVDKNFFDNLLQTSLFEDLPKDFSSCEYHNQAEAKHITEIIHELDFEQKFYYVIFHGDPAA